MSTMPIDNNFLTQKSLQFIGIKVNELAFKSIYIIQKSNNYSIAGGFTCLNQNILHRKILDTSLKMMKRRFRSWGKR